MWFNNALVYQYELEKNLDWAAAFEDEALKPCPPHARSIYGWLPPIGDEMIHESAGTSLIILGKDERILPRGVITKLLNERLQNIEAQQGYPVRRSEKARLAEELEFELLPKSFSIEKRTPAILDHLCKRLIINTASLSQASHFISFLRKTCPGLRVTPLEYSENLALRFANWISNPATLPASCALASDCLLFSLDDEKKRFNCKGYELPAEEILSLLSKGLAAAELSIIWNERIQLTITHEFVLKRLKCLDYLTDEFKDLNQQENERLQQDAALMILANELRALINDLQAELAPSQERRRTSAVRCS